MQMKIIFIDDILYHAQDYKKKCEMTYQKLFMPIIKTAVTDRTTISFNLKNSKNELFSREHFYKLGNSKNIVSRYNSYNEKDFNESQINYLSEFFDNNTIVIGFELYKKFSSLISRFGCKIIDFAHHPFKLFDDLTFAIYTNDKNIYEQLSKYQIPKEKFIYYANYWKVFMEFNGIVKDEDIEENSCLFIGQTLLDKSVDKDGVFLNVTNYEQKLEELSKLYSKTYYLPHPGLGGKRKLIYDFIKNCPYIELLENRSTYGLLASNKISKVVGISTSVLYEAQYFNKEIEYLYKPLFNVDVPFEEHSYISIFEDYWNPKFWADILAPVCDVKNNVPDINHFKGSSNKLRNIGDMYWGYAALDPIKRIPTFQESVKNLYKQYVAPLF